MANGHLPKGCLIGCLIAPVAIIVGIILFWIVGTFIIGNIGQ